MTGVLDYESADIVRLMDMAEDDWTEQELKDALQRAAMLELSTIPPYATALWSITDRDDDEPVFHGVKEIVFDEMSHFGLVCNMLTSIGGTVVLTDPLTVPKYPGELPGGVNPGLEVFLSGLSRESAALFAEIEKPEKPLAFAPDGNTIGAFYQRIADVFPRFAGLIQDRNQVTFPLASHGTGNNIVPMTSLDAILKAIEIIKAQGEGTAASPRTPSPERPANSPTTTSSWRSPRAASSSATRTRGSSTSTARRCRCPPPPRSAGSPAAAGPGTPATRPTRPPPPSCTSSTSATATCCAPSNTPGASPAARAAARSPRRGV